jgi:hypothetical protein
MSPLLEYHHLVWTAPALFIQLRDWCSGRVTHPQAFFLALAWFAIIMVRVFNDFALSTSIGLGYRYMPIACALLAVGSAAVALRGRPGLASQGIAHAP